MANPGDFAYTVKEQADIVRIVGEYVTLKKSGGQNFVGLCPFHKEKTPSFAVHPARQFFHCFGCSVSGDVFSFVQKIENITFPEAVRAVAQRMGIPLPKMSYSSPEEARQAQMRGGLMEIQERACAFFEQQLGRPEASHAREYLAGRGLSDQGIAEFRIGFAPDSGFLLRDHLKRDFDDEVLKASGLLSFKQQEGSADEASTVAMYSKFRNRVMFPICNEQGKVIAFTGRTLAADEKLGPKYLNSPETPIYSKSHVLFNLHKAKDAIRKLGYAILVEGQMDCISVYAAGLHNVIASSGTAFTEVQARLLARFTRNIVVNFDPDTAGAAAAERSLGLLVEEDFVIKVVTLEAGFDPDLFLRKRGRAAYDAALRSAPKYFDYLIDRARQQFPVRTPEGKVKAINFLLPHVQRVSSRIARDELANDMAQKLGIDSAVLRQELKNVVVKRSAATVKSAPEAQVTPAEYILIRALGTPPDRSLGDGDLGGYVRGVLAAEGLHQGLATEALFEKMLESSADPLDLPLSDGERKLVAQLLLREEELLTPELVEQAVAALRRHRLERRQREIKALILLAEKQQDTAALAELLREKSQVDQALRQSSPK